eukprot:GEMP01017623.1.p1 GENE.GEMP01017623.1~~GEMP01017623.1.p1  ORF type:complete len:402 (+),score=73.33 GEMP01017623.1:159-1364(+)
MDTLVMPAMADRDAPLTMEELRSIAAPFEAPARQQPYPDARIHDPLQAVGASSRPRGQRLRPRATIDEFGGHLEDILLPRVDHDFDGRSRYGLPGIVSLEDYRAPSRIPRFVRLNPPVLEEVLPRRLPAARTFAQPDGQPGSRESRGGGPSVAHSSGGSTESWRSAGEGPTPANMSFVPPPAPLLGPQPAPRTRSLSSAFPLEEFFPSVEPRNRVPPPTYFLPPPAAQRTASLDHIDQGNTLEDFFPARRASTRPARRSMTPPHQGVRAHHRTQHFAPRHPTSPVEHAANSEMHDFLPSPMARIMMSIVDPMPSDCMEMFDTFDKEEVRLVRVATTKGDSQESCSICLGEFGASKMRLSMVLHCQHKYHSSCINDYAEFAYDNHGPANVKCPLCRVPFYGT